MKYDVKMIVFCNIFQSNAHNVSNVSVIVKVLNINLHAPEFENQSASVKVNEVS